MHILYINRSDSSCGSCGKSADPYQKGHFVRLGFTGGEGCGVVWTHVSSHYVGMDEAVQAMRPDLTYIPPLEALYRGTEKQSRQG